MRHESPSQNYAYLQGNIQLNREIDAQAKESNCKFSQKRLYKKWGRSNVSSGQPIQSKAIVINFVKALLFPEAVAL